MRKFNLTALATVAALALPVAAQASTAKHFITASTDNYPEQTLVQADPNAAPAAFTTKAQPLLNLAKSTDFYDVEPGACGAGGAGSN